MKAPFPWPVALELVAAIGLRRKLSFHEAACQAIAYLEPPLQVLGREFIPKTGPCLVTTNHYTRPGLPAWWLTFAVSAQLPMEVHWIITAAWTYPDLLRRGLVMPVTRWLFREVARVYGFNNMPPMPPDPAEAAERARTVRQVLAYVRQTPGAVIGMAPEGRDTPRGRLAQPPPGAGRFLLHLSELGLPVIPVGVYEFQGLLVRFGSPYRLDAPQELSAGEKDTWVSHEVMRRIGDLLPVGMRPEENHSPFD